MCGQVQVGVRGKDTEVVEIVGCSTVVADCVQKLTICVQNGYLFERELEKRRKAVGGNESREETVKYIH